MIDLLVEEMLESSNGSLVSGDKNMKVSKIVIDSREAIENTAFFAIIGENQDGHKYIDSAFKNGCRVFIISSLEFVTEEVKNNSTIVQVENTEIALGKISKGYLNKFNGIKIVGVTGSVGKTTTRDLVHSVLSYKYNTIKNEKNFNNQFGVPLTLFNTSYDTECEVIEMGMCGFGEIDYLAELVKPNIAIISNIGLSHIENLGSQEGILKAKMEISNYMDENGLLIVNGDDLHLNQVYMDYRNGKSNNKFRVCSFGKFPVNTACLKNMETLDNVSTKFTIKLDGFDELLEFEIPTVGEHNVYNAMAAIIAGNAMEMSIDEIKAGLLNFKPTKDRQDIIKTDKYMIINDVYNASPDSMIASLKVLSLFEDRKVAILGDCLEMGDYEEKGHRKIGSQSIGKADVLINVGNASKFIGIEAKEKGFDLSNVYYFETKEEFFNEIDEIIQDGDVILVKASRGMKFEEIVEKLKGGEKC